MSEQTIAQIMSEKIASLGMKKRTAVKTIAKTCNCSDVAVYCWINGVNRPQRKFLQGISDCLSIRLSRLQEAWMKTAKAVKVKPKLSSGRLYKNVTKPTTNNSFVPAKENPYLILAIDLVKLSKEKRKIVERFVDTLDKHLVTKELDQ